MNSATLLQHIQKLHHALCSDVGRDNKQEKQLCIVMCQCCGENVSWVNSDLIARRGFGSREKCKTCSNKIKEKTPPLDQLARTRVELQHWWCLLSLNGRRGFSSAQPTAIHSKMDGENRTTLAYIDIILLETSFLEEIRWENEEKPLKKNISLFVFWSSGTQKWATTCEIETPITHEQLHAK